MFCFNSFKTCFKSGEFHDCLFHQWGIVHEKIVCFKGGFVQAIKNVGISETN